MIRQLIPYETIATYLSRILQPFVNGVRLLHQVGFNRTMVHDLPPA